MGRHVYINTLITDSPFDVFDAFPRQVIADTLAHGHSVEITIDPMIDGLTVVVVADNTEEDDMNYETPPKPDPEPEPPKPDPNDPDGKWIDE